MNSFSRLSNEGNNATTSVGNGNFTPFEGRRNVFCTAVILGGKENSDLNDVLDVREIVRNLLSVSKCPKAGLKLTFDSEK